MVEVEERALGGLAGLAEGEGACLASVPFPLFALFPLLIFDTFNVFDEADWEGRGEEEEGRVRGGLEEGASERGLLPLMFPFLSPPPPPVLSQIK